MDPVLKAQLERDEGRELTAYTDTNGFWTIGVGHLIGRTCRILAVTDAECDAFLAWDIQSAEAALVPVFGQMNRGASCGAARYRALVNMAFNRGQKHMQESTTITPAIKVSLSSGGYWDLVAIAISASPWAAQIGARAKRLAKQLATGIDQ
jgi:GH24 family phage-related lysozyme (muramidase)